MREDIKEIVARARKRAEDQPGLLIEGAFARDNMGKLCSATDPNASCFCTLGLIANEAGMDIGIQREPGQPDEYIVMSKDFFGEGDRNTLVDDVISATDDLENYIHVRPICTNVFARAVGLAGFDLIDKWLAER